MTSLAGAERAALLDLLEELGPDAPTLCEGWTTYDLAAHLVVRERRPLAVPGLAVPQLHGITEAYERRMRRTPYPALVQRLRSGPPLWSPAGALKGPLDGLTDLHEMYVHHEDVRRLADPAPREPVPGLDDALWSRIRLMGRGLVRGASGLGISLRTPDGRTARLRRGDDEVVVLGNPRELMMWVFGRRSAARVELEGSPEACERAATGPLA